MKSAKEALATHLGMDTAELTEYRYQPGRFTKTVYAVADSYYCAGKDSLSLPKPTRESGMTISWAEVPDPYVNGCGWKIFSATE